jgi:hypothetical protein
VIVGFAVAVSHCYRVRADSDCDAVVEVLFVPPAVATLDAAARGRGRVCNAAPPLCVASVVTSMLGVQWSGVLLFCMCIPCCIHSLFAIAVLLLLLLLYAERLLARA